MVRNQVRGKEVDIKWYWQPRLGIAHPVAENAALHYSWGKFYSPLPFSYLYDEYGVFANPSLPSIGDVDADPPEATAYEIGLQYSFHPDYLLDVTAYYRDIENYGRIGYMISPAAGAGFGTYAYATSFGYGDSRGFEIALERRPVGTFSGRLNYAFSYVKQAFFASDDTPFPNRTSFAAGTDTNIPFEDRETFNTFEANVRGGGNPLTGGFDREHRIGAALLGQLRSGVQVALITTAASGFIYRVVETSDDPRSRETDSAPWNVRTDLRLTRGFDLGAQRLNGFLEVRNLFDRENILTFDNRNVASTIIWEEEQDPTGDLNRSFTQEALPIYDIAREINLGFSIDF